MSNELLGRGALRNFFGAFGFYTAKTLHRRRVRSQQLFVATSKAIKTLLVVADRAIHQVAPLCEARLDSLDDVLFDSVVQG